MYDTGRSLEIANRRIALYNKNLEKIISNRTKTIQKLNETLIEYAFFNSHKIRGPLARILRLVYLIKLSCIKNGKRIPCEIVEYINRLTESAVELDVAIKEINLLLENGDNSFSEEKITHGICIFTDTTLSKNTYPSLSKNTTQK